MPQDWSLTDQDHIRRAREHALREMLEQIAAVPQPFGDAIGIIDLLQRGRERPLPPSGPGARLSPARGLRADSLDSHREWAPTWRTHRRGPR